MSDKNLLWLWTHCRAIGMTKKADASPDIDPLTMDVALFTEDQRAELDRLRRELAEAQRDAARWRAARAIWYPIEADADAWIDSVLAAETVSEVQK